MGVDFTGHYGIGVKIDSIDFDEEELDKEIAELGHMCEFLDENLNTEIYNWFEVGDGNYSGKENDFYIVIKDPFKDGLNNLEQKKDKLLQHIKEIGLEISDDFGVVGGLEVY